MPPAAIFSSVSVAMRSASASPCAAVVAQQQADREVGGELRRAPAGRRCASSKARLQARHGGRDDAPDRAGGWPRPRRRRDRGSICARTARTSASRGLRATRAGSLRRSRWMSPSSVEETVPRAPRPVARREIGAAEERLAIGRQPDAHRPAARSGERLHRAHVDRVDVGPLLAIDLDADVVAVHEGARSPRPRTTRPPSRGTSGRWSTRSRGRPARRSRRASANASSPQACQSTGLCACCSR